jgi:HK97 family phage major capsid protein
MNPRLKALREQFNQAKAGIEKIEAAATNEKRELTDDEQSQADTLYARCEELRPDIEKLADKERSLSATADVLASLGLSSPNAPATPGARREVKVPTAGEWFSTYFRAEIGDTDAVARMEDYLRAVDVQVSADAGATLPKPIVGDILKIYDASRPVFSSLTPRPMPTEGKTFVRPRVTQRVLVGEQLAEDDELASRGMVLTGDDVSKRTIGGTLELTRQDIDWTNPSMLQLAIDDFADAYAEWTEGAACTALVAAATNTSLWTPTDVATIIASITAGVQENYDNSKRLPDTMWLDLGSALDLAAVTNSDDSVTAIEMIRKALQFVGINLNFVVGPQLPADTRILGNHLRIESYEQQLGLLTAEMPSRLKRQIAYAGYLAFHLRPESLVSLEAA